MDDQLRKSALEYHASPRPGKIATTPTKALSNQRDLALAYSPGVAAPCEEIAADPASVAKYTSRGNLVAVISNGTAVLGLGDIGPLAAKPVMEGKGVLFKKFAGIDVFDIEIDEKDPDRLVDIIASLEPTFGGINLEDIKSPECFIVEEKLRDRVKIPVFHDDQHGTAIIAAAAILNSLRLVEKDIGDVRLVTSGAGAASIACLKLLESLGLSVEHMLAVDRKGVIYAGREGADDPHKAPFARETDLRTLEDAMAGADIFLGLSGPGVVSREMVASMADKPIILALANPTPEILPEEVKAVRDDAIIATGRSDYPNQVNNVLCFPYLFRGALDVGATTINEAMKLACVRALADLTMQEASELVQAAYSGEELKFGPEYVIPKPFDPRLVSTLPPAVAEAAMASGVATRPLKDLAAYRSEMERYVFQSVVLMKPLFEKAKSNPQRVAYADGEDLTILRAVQSVVDDGLAQPILVGRPDVITTRIRQLGLRLRADRDFQVVNPEHDKRYKEYSEAYHELMKRNGVSVRDARTLMRTNNTVIASMLVKQNNADALICGMTGSYKDHLRHAEEILGKRPDVSRTGAMTALLLPKGSFFVCDTQVNHNPTAAEIADYALLTVERVTSFGIVPKVALLSHSNFGDSNEASAQLMRDALQIIRRRAPDLCVDGEMHSDAALVPSIREALINGSTLQGQANVFVMPSVDAANITVNMLKILNDGVTVGPIALGLRPGAHILTPSATVRRVINMSTLAAVDAMDVKAQTELNFVGN
ncbi:MAG: NADP-dependent malic enzyme [Gammaproteobacteria bacterium]